MRTITGMFVLFCLSALVFLAGCGGGGGSPAPAATKVKLSTSGTLPQGSQKLGGIDVVIKLPSGVTVNADAANVVPDGVITSTVAPQFKPSLIQYTPAAGTLAGTLRFIIVGNFDVGDFATVNFILAPGSALPVAGDVTITPADQGLKPVTTISVVTTPVS